MTKPCVPNLKGIKIKVSAFGVPPFVIFTPKGQLIGTDIEVIKILSSVYGFKIELKRARAWKLDITDNNGHKKSVGVIPDVVSRKATLGVGPHLFFRNTYLVCDYLFHTYLYLRYTSPKPDKLPPLVNITKPFTPGVWLSVLITLVIVCLAFIGFRKIYGNSKDSIEDAMIIFMCQFSQSK